GKVSAPASTEPINDASMWPRLFSRGKEPIQMADEDDKRASMWPRLFSRGKHSLPRQPAGSLARFNVAATVQPRKARLCNLKRGNFSIGRLREVEVDIAS